MCATTCNGAGNDKAMAIPLSNRYLMFRCNQCGDLVPYMLHFVDYEYHDAIPRYCPNCRREFTNGGALIA